MTEINYTQKGEKVRISIVGHALFRPGNDIVCAGVSAITFQLITLAEELEDEKLIYDLLIEVRDGFVIMTFSLVPEMFERWDTMWRVIRIGYRNIAEQYPDNVCFV